jgi:hypothetical protein
MMVLKMNLKNRNMSHYMSVLDVLFDVTELTSRYYLSLFSNGTVYLPMLSVSEVM